MVRDCKISLLRLKSTGFLTKNPQPRGFEIRRLTGLTHILVNIQRWIQPRPLGMRCIFITEIYIGLKNIEFRADSLKYLCVIRIGCVIW